MLLKEFESRLRLGDPGILAQYIRLGDPTLLSVHIMASWESAVLCRVILPPITRRSLTPLALRDWVPHSMKYFCEECIALLELGGSQCS